MNAADFNQPKGDMQMNAVLKLDAASPLTMTSQEVADLVAKRHDNVKRTIEALAGQGVIVHPQIEDEPGQDSMGRPRITQVYVFSGERGKRDSLVVVAQLSPEFTGRLVDRWQELEAANQPSFALPNFNDPVASARAWADEVEAKRLALTERDEAVRTKALIGSRREATAMATASAAKREVARLRDELGRNARHATIMAVEGATKHSFGSQGWRPLRAYCEAHGLAARSVSDPRYGEVKAWPAQAWNAVYDVDLAALFPDGAN